MLDASTDKGGYVNPIVNCPHSINLPDLALIKAYTAFQSPCVSCSSTEENWFCLQCHVVACSRYVKGHMSQHNRENNDHAVAISLSDLNAWCYACDSYVVSMKVGVVHKTLHLVKFGSVPGDNLAIDVVEGGKKVDVLGSAEEEEDLRDVEEKVKVLAKLVRESKRCVLFTGAGISTSAKIPDFRGPEGVWTLKAKGIQADLSMKLESAVPTKCHMAIISLVKSFKDSGKDIFVISQNIDGLHRRSGLKKEDLSELHGNSFVEVCWKCENDYLRTFDTAVESGRGGQNCTECKKRVPQFCHCTSRRCECGEVLKDSIIHFGENLPKRDLNIATEKASNADLIIVLGSSLTVSPANHMIEYTKENNGKVCIVNLQRTIKDSKADIRIFSKTDKFMELLLGELGLVIPEFDISNFFAN